MEAGWGQPKSVLFEKRDTMKDGANTETQSKNIDYDFTKKKNFSWLILSCYIS